MMEIWLENEWHETTPHNMGLPVGPVGPCLGCRFGKSRPIRVKFGKPLTACHLQVYASSCSRSSFDFVCSHRLLSILPVICGWRISTAERRRQNAVLEARTRKVINNFACSVQPTKLKVDLTTPCWNGSRRTGKRVVSGLVFSRHLIFGKAAERQWFWWNLYRWVFGLP